MNWELVPFGSIYTEPSRNGVYKSKEHHGVGVKIINMGELFSNGIISNQEMKRLNMSNSEMERFGLKDGDLLFGRRSLVESGAGKCILVENLSEPTTFESSIIRVRINKNIANPRFYYYWFQSHQGKGNIRSIITGTNVKGITGNNLKKILISIPPLKYQAKIVKHLKNYDDLIENNRRRIALLEQAARLLYKEWFVHLRFPGHQRAKIVDGVPEGWEKKALGKIGKLNYGKSLKADNRIPGPFPVFGSSGIVGSHQKSLVKGPGIIVGRKGNVGSVFWSDEDFYPIDTVYFIESSASSFFLYYALKQTQFINTDVAVPGLNRDLAHSREILFPENRLRILFEESISPFHNQIKILNKYNEELAKARDLLLPRLMNGDVKV